MEDEGADCPPIPCAGVSEFPVGFAIAAPVPAGTIWVIGFGVEGLAAIGVEVVAGGLGLGVVLDNVTAGGAGVGGVLCPLPPPVPPPIPLPFPLSLSFRCNNFKPCSLGDRARVPRFLRNGSIDSIIGCHQTETSQS